jgi:hypothetical protein
MTHENLNLGTESLSCETGILGALFDYSFVMVFLYQSSKPPTMSLQLPSPSRLLRYCKKKRIRIRKKRRRSGS